MSEPNTDALRENESQFPGTNQKESPNGTVFSESAGAESAEDRHLRESELARAPRTVSLDPIITSRVTDEDTDEIDAFVARSNRTCFWHDTAWMRAVSKVYRMPDRSLLARRNGAVVGYLPLALTETLTLGRNLISVPYGVYGGIAGDDEAIENALLESGKTLALAERVGHLELRHRDARCSQLPRSSLYVTFERELPTKPEETLAMLPRKARAAARQGRDKFHLTFDEGLWFLDDFYHLFSSNKRHLGSPPLPKRFFEALIDQFRGRIYLHIVRLGSQPIAGVMSYRFKDTLLPYYSGGLAQFESTQCNNFLYWKLMEWGVEHGFKRFDFGRSRRDTGPYNFKRNQGFEPKDLHYGYFLVRSRAIPQMNPGNPVFDLPRRVWQKLPLPIHERLGGLLSLYLP